jgi:hypothetical protein
MQQPAEKVYSSFFYTIKFGCKIIDNTSIVATK